MSTPTPSSAAEATRADKVYVANSGRDFDGEVGPHNIAIFTVRADGGLTPFGDPVPTGLGARSLEFGPNGRFAYLVALEEDAVYSYAVDRAGGLTGFSPVPTGGQSPFGMVVAPDGRSLYTADIGSGTVSAFRVRGSGAPVLAGTTPTGQPDPRNVVVSRDGRFLFVSHGLPDSAGPDALVVFPILPGGTLDRPRPPVAIGGGGTGMALTPDGRFLYIACSGTNDVYAFRIRRNGAVNPVPGQPFPAPRTPEGVAITPDGTRLYVTSVASQPEPDPTEAGIWTFAISDDGALTALGPRTGSGLGPGVVVTADGQHLYTGNFFGNTVSAFTIATGPPEEIADSPYPSRGTAPAFDAVAIRPRMTSE
ncbi:lactonase family protein [Nocardia transvalensis]|uniref:lactonase family protein n=1 Tax=Nocardia transvalensis TaxID=37333 RepID=UPI001894F40D|nr:beta-propeller fold lactonase family protein [Nocardia transvalensis]MBF6331485.1 beta-propeller fold lactonase family protein [Nocardia transvalensis]